MHVALSRPELHPRAPYNRLPAVEARPLHLRPDRPDCGGRVSGREEGEGEPAPSRAGQLGVDAALGRDAGHPLQAGVGDAERGEQALVGVDQLLKLTVIRVYY